MEHTETGESDCILAVKLSGLLLCDLLGVGEAELECEAVVKPGSSCCGGVARMATGVCMVCGL